jgi:hypothetical protein
MSKEFKKNRGYLEIMLKILVQYITDSKVP